MILIDNVEHYLFGHKYKSKDLGTHFKIYII